MKTDTLRIVISITALLIFIVYATVLVRSSDKETVLEGGNIEKAIQTEQYR